MLGSNVPTVGGLSKAFEHAEQWRCECIQVYTTRSRQWAVPEMSESELAAFREARARSSVREIVAHVPFLVNLASPDSSCRAKSVDRLAIELTRAQDLGIRHIVLHPGSSGSIPRAQGIRWVTAGLNEVLERVEPRGSVILLENMAGQGTAIGSFFEDLAEILSGVTFRERVGVCFDTAHAFIAGYALSNYDGYSAILKQFDDIIGLHEIKAIHMNDAKTRLGSRHDRHAAIGEGRMGLRVFHAMLRDRRFAEVPKILEIPERDEKSAFTLQRLRDLVHMDGEVADGIAPSGDRQLTLLL